MKRIEGLKFFEVYRTLTDKEIPGIYPDRYEVSNFGRVFDKKLNRYCKISIRSDGYKSVSLNVNNTPKSYLLHRIVGLLFVDGDKSLIINHKDTKKGNCFYENLEWVTYSENNIHAFANNLSRKGEESPKAIITEEQAEFICKCLDEHKLSYADIAKECGIVSPDASSLISAIRRGESWRHVSCKYNFSKDYKGGRYKWKQK